MGTDANSLTEVATTTEAKYTLNQTSNLNTYYWRIDEEDAAVMYTKAMSGVSVPVILPSQVQKDMVSMLRAAEAEAFIT